MAINHKFKLKSTDIGKKTSIQYMFYHSNRRFVYSIGSDMLVFPSFWDESTQRPITSKLKEKIDGIKSVGNLDISQLRNELRMLNTRMDNVTRCVDRYFTLIELNNSHFNKEELKSKLDAMFKPTAGLGKSSKEESSRIKTVIEFLEELTSDMTSGKVMKVTREGNKVLYTRDTIKAYKVLAVKLAEFKEYAGKRKLEFKDIDLDFYDQFQDYSTSKGYSPNYFGNLIKNIKATLQRAYDLGLHNNITFKDKKFKKTSSESLSIALTKEELNRMLNLDLSGSRLEKYRDVFVVGCYTAQRYSDYSRFNDDMLIMRNGSTFLKFNQSKTNTMVEIPCKPIVLNLLEKYDGAMPITTNQKLNDALKEIGYMIMPDTFVVVNDSSIPSNRNKRVPKFTLLTSHVARRTGATIMYKGGIPNLDIMKITGHKTETEFYKYIKVTNEETADRLSGHSFFT